MKNLVLAMCLALVSPLTSPADDWKPSTRWRGFNLLGMFRCPSMFRRELDARMDAWFAQN